MLAGFLSIRLDFISHLTATDIFQLGLSNIMFAVYKAFSVRVGVHLGSVLSPLLFIIVLEALSREFREGLPMELLYADDLVLVAETEELLMEKLRKWKKGMELKGLRVNIGKTKVKRCQVRIGQAEDSGKFPCGVCR